MRVLVTGGCGFIGTNLTMRCVDLGWDVEVVDRDISRMGAWRSGPYEKAIIHNCDFASDSILDAVRSNKYDVILHQAAVPRVSYSVEHPAETTEENVLKTVRLLEAASGHCSRFVFASSSSVYGDTDKLPLHEGLPTNPKSPYALQKLTCELFIRQFCAFKGLDAISLRYFNVFGPWQYGDSPYSTALSAWCYRLKHNLPLRSDGTGEQSRDLCTTGDAQILMADLSYKRADQVVPGDQVLAFDEKPNSNKKRFFRSGKVSKTAHYTPQKLYAVRMKNGNTIKCTAEHPWLTERGFRTTEQLYLAFSAKEKCLSIKSLVPPHQDWNDYIQPISDKSQYDLGYLAGSLDGDGTYGRYIDSRNGQDIFACSLRVTDTEFADYFDEAFQCHGIACKRSEYQPTYPGAKRAYTVRTNKRSSCEFVTHLFEDISFENSDFCRGYLAAIYDREGDAHRDKTLRLSNTDERILKNVEFILDRFGFAYSNRPKSDSDVRLISVNGGLMEHIRFFQLFQPKITRKWPTVTGREVKTYQNEVQSISLVEIEPVYTIEIEDHHTYIANGMLCHNCYVDNVVEANLCAATSMGTFQGETFNIACGDRTSNNQILEALRKRYPDLQVEHAPFRAGDIMHTQADISMAQRYIGYKPVVRFWEGFERTLKWWGLNSAVSPTVAAER